MLTTIYPYLYDDTCWVFDDPRTGLKEEAFVLGASEMISRLVAAKGIQDAARGFTLTFAAEPFDHDVVLHWLTPGEAAARSNLRPSEMPGVGNWYQGVVAGQPMIGWLCPALFCYFEEAPQRIYVKAEPLPPGVDPIWHVAAGDAGARRFISPPAGPANEARPVSYQFI